MLTMMPAIILRINPGMISYTPVDFARPVVIQINTVAAPTIMAASAPHSFIRFQYRLSRIAGPKAEPKPAQAYPTKSRMVLFGFNDKSTAITAMTKTDNRPIMTNVFIRSFSSEK